MPRRSPLSRRAKAPGEREWERADVVTAQPGPRLPGLISDGGGLPFPPQALTAPSGELDQSDPAVAALAAELESRRAKNIIGSWRLLARSDDEVLFGRDQPPELVTATVRLDKKQDTWAFAGASIAETLRASRDGIRASSWRLDSDAAPDPDATELRLLVTEQAFASGQRANGRILTPDVYLDGEELILTIYVKPRPGFQTGSRNPDTAVRVQLPAPVGGRRLVDGALPRLPDGTAASAAR